jgi:Holliday junction resolvase RusA-like endonuclease
MNFFDYLNSINYSKKDIMVDDIAEDEYNPFMVNRSLSYFQDTILYANEMNKYHHLDNRLQFDFLINIVRKRKRFSKWSKNTDPDALNIVKEYYGYSNEKARQALSVLSNEQISELKKRMFKGGK